MSAVYVTLSRQGEVCGRCSGNGCSSCGGHGEVGVDLAEWSCHECDATGEGDVAACPVCGCDDVRILDERGDREDDGGADWDGPEYHGSRCEP